MKLYRIRYKKSFVTRLPTEEIEWNPPKPDEMPAKITMMPGVPVEECEMIAAHMAERRVEIPAHDEEIITVIPEKTYIEHERVPAHYQTKSEYIDGHYETKETWIPEHEEDKLVEIHGYYETRYRPTGMAKARGLTWPKEAYEFWVDPTWEVQTVTVPGQYRDHRVWIAGHIGDVEVWIQDQYKPVTKVIPEHKVTTILAMPVRMAREEYWKEEYEKCWMVTKDVPAVAGVPMDATYLHEMELWFAWYQTTTAGQLFISGAQSYGWMEDWTSFQVMHKAYELYRGFQPDVKWRLAPDVVMKIPEYQIRKILPHVKKVPKDPMTIEEVEMLWGAAAKAALIAAAAYLVYFTWPGAKFDYKVTYTDWVYVLRYKEEFTYADLVGVSLKGKPKYVLCEQTGGPIMGEERSKEYDKWYFGQEWKWSAYTEEARWWGIGETRHWFEAEVEYLGMVKKSGAIYYTLHENITASATARHERGWSKPVADWGKWKEVEEHERI